jgi:hypothetical protein
MHRTAQDLKADWSSDRTSTSRDFSGFTAATPPQIQRCRATSAQSIAQQRRDTVLAARTVWRQHRQVCGVRAVDRALHQLRL